MIQHAPRTVRGSVSEVCSGIFTKCGIKRNDFLLSSKPKFFADDFAKLFGASPDCIGVHHYNFRDSKVIRKEKS